MMLNKNVDYHKISKWQSPVGNNRSLGGKDFKKYILIQMPEKFSNRAENFYFLFSSHYNNLDML